MTPPLDIAPARGKLGVLLVGLGAVATTTIAGVFAIRKGLALLDNHFPAWLEDVVSETDDGLTLRFRDVEAVRNVASTLRNHGVMPREWERAA